MTLRQINNATVWAKKVLNYSDEENIPLLGTNEARKKAIRYLNLVKQHENKTGECVGDDDDIPLTDYLCAIKYAQL